MRWLSALRAAGDLVFWVVKLVDIANPTNPFGDWKHIRWSQNRVVESRGKSIPPRKFPLRVGLMGARAFAGFTMLTANIELHSSVFFRVTSTWMVFSVDTVSLRRRRQNSYTKFIASCERRERDGSNVVFRAQGSPPHVSGVQTHLRYLYVQRVIQDACNDFGLVSATKVCRSLPDSLQKTAGKWTETQTSLCKRLLM